MFFLVAVLSLSVIGFFIIFNRNKFNYSLIEATSFDENFKRAGLKIVKDIFFEKAQYKFEKVLSPSKIYVTDSLITIYDNQRKVVEQYSLYDGKLLLSYFEVGRGSFEILSGSLSTSTTKSKILFNDIQQYRIIIRDAKNNNFKAINTKHLPESSSFDDGNNKIYIRSYDIENLAAELDDNGEIVRYLNLKPLEKISPYHLGAQGKMTASQDLLLISFNYATPIYGYSLSQDSTIFIADTPISIPIPKPYVEKSGNRTTYKPDPNSIMTNLDICISGDYIFVLYSGGVPNKVKSLTDILLVENSKMLNIFSRKSGKYICSSEISIFAHSFDVQENKLYAITNLNDQELTKVFVYDIDVKKIKELAGE